MCEKAKELLKLQFDRRVRLEFRGTRITSDAALLACRELDEAAGLIQGDHGRFLEKASGGRFVYQKTSLGWCQATK